jgi:hypothetical protein
MLQNTLIGANSGSSASILISKQNILELALSTYQGVKNLQLLAAP